MASDVGFNEQRFLTLIFDRLLTAKCTDFLADLKSEKRKWAKDPASVSYLALYFNKIRVGYHLLGKLQDRWIPNNPQLSRNFSWNFRLTFGLRKLL